MKNDALLKNMKNTFYSYYIFVDQIFYFNFSAQN